MAHNLLAFGMKHDNFKSIHCVTLYIPKRFSVSLVLGSLVEHTISHLCELRAIYASFQRRALRMDLFEEVEAMAMNATINSSQDDECSETEIATWQKLFGYSYTEADKHIQNQRNDLISTKLTDDHWDVVKSEKEAQGYSREAYDHYIAKRGFVNVSHCNPKGTPAVSPTRNNVEYMVRLEGILATRESIQIAAGLPDLPEIIDGVSEDGNDLFCTIDGNAKQRIRTWLDEQGIIVKPTFIRISKARKDLSHNSIFPTLGLESTLPQHRLSPGRALETITSHSRDTSSSTTSPVLQDEYPVWYFFYGTLADPDTLMRVLSLPNEEFPVLVPASICRGRLITWTGKYEAMIDGEVWICLSSFVQRT